MARCEGCNKNKAEVVIIDGMNYCSKCAQKIISEKEAKKKREKKIEDEDNQRTLDDVIRRAMDKIDKENKVKKKKDKQKDIELELD